MEKAAKVLRRSSARLKALNDGCSAELRIAASETADVGTAARSLAESQATACKHVLQWSTKQTSSAIQDVAAQMEQLNLLLSEAILQYSGSAECFSEVFTRLTEDERSLNRLKAKLAESERDVAKRRAELKKALKKACSEKSRQALETRVSEAERVRGLQQIELAQQTVETEAVKCIRFKQGIARLSDAGILFGRNCVSIYKALKEVADNMPDVLDADSSATAYSGFEASRLCVARARHKIEKRLQQPTCGNSSRNASLSATATQTSHDMVEERSAQLPSSVYSPVGCRDPSVLQVPIADDDGEVPPPYRLGYSVGSSPCEGDKQRCRDHGSRRSRASSSIHGPKDVDRPSFIEIKATSTPRATAPMATDVVRADVDRTTCGFDVTASSSGYLSMATESPAGNSSSRWHGCCDGTSGSSGSCATTCSSPTRPSAAPALATAGTVVGQSPTVSSGQPPPAESLAACSPAPSSSTADALVAQPVDDGEERGGGGGGSGGDHLSVRRIFAAAPPVLERHVERQVLYRHVASQALPPTLLCRQASTASTSSRRSRAALLVSSPE